ncbi:hypothetical protein T4B_14509, partial [Trichinella pseudospiralis]
LVGKAMAPPPIPPPVGQSSAPPPPPPLLKSGGTNRGTPSADRSALLADIRKAGAGGVRLRPTKTNDRSAPMVVACERTFPNADTNGSSNISGSLASSNRLASNGRFPKVTKANASLDFASELNRAINAQQERTLKKSHGAIAAGSETGINGIGRPPGRVKESQANSCGQLNASVSAIESELAQKLRLKAPSVSVKPVPNPNKPSLRFVAGEVCSANDAQKPADLSGVSVKALREKLQMPQNGSLHAAKSSSTIGQQQASSKRLSGHSYSSGTLPHSSFQNSSNISNNSNNNKPPLPAKPPSRKPSIEQRRNMPEKFRTLRPNQISVNVKTLVRSNSSENMTDLIKADNVNSTLYHNSDDKPVPVAPATQRGTGTCFPPANRPMPPPRPDIAPPPPPTVAIEKSKQANNTNQRNSYGGKVVTNVPPPPPRGDSLTHEFQNRFYFKPISNLPLPPEFRHLRQLSRATKRNAPKPPIY